MKTYKFSEATRKKMSETRKRLYKEGSIVPYFKGKQRDKETREKISKSNKGKHLSEETKQKLREYRLGKKHKPSQLEKLRLNAKNNLNYGMKGKHFSEDTKTKMRESRLKGLSEGKIKIWNKGIKQGDLRKTPMSEISKKIVKTRKERHNYFHTEETKRKISKGHLGLIAWNKDKICPQFSKENNPNWQGGKSFEPYEIEFNTQFKNLIRKRDNQICMNCGKHREKLNRALDVHHINYDKKLSIPENCISLCRSCHTLTQTNREYWTKLCQEKLNNLYGYKYSENGEIILNFVRSI